MTNDLLINVGLSVLLLLIGTVFGRINEKRHFKSIRRRERALAGLIVYNRKQIPEDAGIVEEPFVSGFVVLSNDYLKNFLSSIRKLFGGRIRSYETLVKRAKREAVLRLKEEAHKKGATAVYNIRVDTTSISKGWSRGVVTIEAYAYGTAVK